MPEKRTIGDVKHKYALDEFGNSINILDAQKFINGKKVKYYLFENQSLEAILKQGEKNRWHYAIKSDAKINIGGNFYAYSNYGESPEHLDFKYKIMKNEFFYWNEYKIYIYNVKVEAKIYGSMFKADCTGQLSDGTRVFIEVIKTSETSKSKKQYLKSNELLTFEIWIDDEGNQLSQRFDIYGNSEIESIEGSIQEMQSRIPNCERERRKAWNSYYREKERVDSEIRSNEDSAAEWFRQQEKEIEYSEFDNGRTLQFEIDKRRSEAFKVIEKIRKNQSNIFKSRIQIKKNIERIRYVRNSKQRLFDVLSFFEKIDCKIKVRLDKATLIEDVNKFSTNHLSFVKNNISNKSYRPYYERLVKLKNILNNDRPTR
jgi:hypothetical protein